MSGLYINDSFKLISSFTVVLTICNHHTKRRSSEFPRKILEFEVLGNEARLQQFFISKWRSLVLFLKFLSLFSAGFYKEKRRKKKRRRKKELMKLLGHQLYMSIITKSPSSFYFSSVCQFAIEIGGYLGLLSTPQLLTRETLWRGQKENICRIVWFTIMDPLGVFILISPKENIQVLVIFNDLLTLVIG